MNFRDNLLIAGAVVVTFAVFSPLIGIQSSTASNLAETNSACLECHSDYAENLKNTLHKVTPQAFGSKLPQVFCTDCHGEATKHLEEPSPENITNPAKSPIFDLVKNCASCHQSEHVREFSESNIHFRENIGCLNCHSIHQSKAEALLLRPSVPLCLSCHTQIKQKLANPSRHPVSDQKVKCIDCHQILKEPGQTFSLSGADQACFNCHQEFQGPFIYEHNASNDYSIEKGGCLSCHDPHGSPNPRLLLQPEKQLCQQCHSIPKHRTAHGGVFASRNCGECHADVHGSYTDQDFFNDNLLAQNCFLAGCHYLDQ